jgi:translation initiation factor IF-2
MARKRIKTLALEWNVPVEEVLASCARLKLAHAQSDSSLLKDEEAERIRADLDGIAHRTAILNREKVLETTAGKVVEKRLQTGIVRRRHAGPEASQEPSPPPGVAFDFKFDETREESAAPFLDELPALEIATAEPEFELEAPLETSVNGGAAAGEIEAAAAPATIHAEAPARVLGETPAERAPETPAQASQSSSADAVAAPIRPAPSMAAQPAAGPSRTTAHPEPPARGMIRPFQPGRAINLVRTLTSGPSLDDVQQGPKVLGRIDLRKPVVRPVAPFVRPTAPGMRPGAPSRFGQSAPPALGAPSEPPSESVKPGGARTIKKKRVVKKDALDLAAERQMRSGRFPKKRRALPGKEQKQTAITVPKASKRVVRISEGVTVADLARNMGVKAAEVIKKLMALGVMSTVNQVLDVDTATLVASEFGYNVENVAFDVESAIEEGAEEVVGEPTPRPPVVTVMGHVDHGKTSLLDAIRHTNVTADEFGGITQHIGAYTVTVKGRVITFIDTPGHEAFTSMRARGAKVTDIVILVVAADEGLMPQTIEAINHARAAKVPIIVAINKIDRPEANVDRVKQQLSEQGLIPEDYGGDVIAVPVSARTREGLDRLLEMILLQADVLELKANAQRTARGIVIESQLDRGRGPVATVLIQEGTLHAGEAFVCGTTYGRVRAMLNHLGQKLEQAGPATPVEIFGLSSVPEPGMMFTAVAEEAKARQVAEFRASKQREGELTKTSRVSLEDLSARMKAGDVKELKVIVKGDVQGSVEAVSEALRRLSTDEVKLEIIHASAGAVSETDVTLASASRGIVIGFNIRPEAKAAALAEKEGVEIRLYTIIYEAINDIREAMEGLLAPTYRERAMGRAEVRKTFAVPGGTIAGSMVVDGKIGRASRARLVRDGRVVWEGKIGSLRRFKEDAREVQSGYECGIGLENFNDVKPDDRIETFEMEAVLRKLAPASRPEAARGQAAVEKQL